MDNQEADKLNTNVQYLKGIGPAKANSLKKLDIENINDLFEHYPKKYEDRTNPSKLSYEDIGFKKAIKGKILNNITSARIRKNFSIQKTMAKSGNMMFEIIWYNRPYYVNMIKKDDEYIFFGKIEQNRGYIQISNPEIEKSGENKFMNKILPIYPLTKNITQRNIREASKDAIDKYIKYVKEYHTNDFLKQNNLMNLR